MKYRDHRGNLDESMKTEIIVNSVDDIIEHLNKVQYPYIDEVEEIKFKYCGFDTRNGWDTYYVLQKNKGDDEFYVAGMSDGEFKL